MYSSAYISEENNQNILYRAVELVLKEIILIPFQSTNPVHYVSSDKLKSMKAGISAILLSLVVLSSCSRQDETPENDFDYIMFGHFYGFCLGEQCIELFKLTEEGIYEDTTDQYPSRIKAYEGKFVKLDDQKFKLVKSIVDDIPSELLIEKDTVIGYPDISDGGGVYFAIKNELGTRFWLVDQFDRNLPTYLIPFKNQINASISLIND